MDCNAFQSSQRNNIEVPLDLLFFRNDTEEEIEDTVRQRESGENYEQECHSRRKSYQHRDEDALIEHMQAKKNIKFKTNIQTRHSTNFLSFSKNGVGLPTHLP